MFHTPLPAILRPLVRPAILLLAVIMPLCCPARNADADTYSRLSLKASRFFEQKEWAQAAATYYQMLEIHPEVPATYGRAIVANAILSDTVAQLQLMAKAIDNKIPFDSVLSRVKQTSYSLGKSNMYGHFLLRLQDAYPWMRRPIDNYLLRHYTWRRDGQKMMTLAAKMLDGAPRNVDFMAIYADGAMLCGRTDEALAAWKRILSVAPDHYATLINLGVYYYMQVTGLPPAPQGLPTAHPRRPGRVVYPDTPLKADALAYLNRANTLHPTPKLQVMLARLGTQ